MRKLLYIFSVLFIVSVTRVAHAQVPGFIGKRLSVAYNLLTFFPPRFIHDESEKLFLFTTRHELNLNYCIARRVEVFGSFVYADAKMPFGEFEMGNSYDLTHYRFSPSNEKNKFNARMFGAGLRFFTGRYIAPVGKYFKLQARYLMYGVPKKGIPGEIRYYRINGVPADMRMNTNLVPTELSKSAINLNFGFGVQKIARDYLALNLYTGVNFYLDSDWPSLSKGNWHGDVDNYIYGTVQRGIRTRSYFDIAFGIAYFLK